MKQLKSVRIPRGYTGLHCEVPGCVVNIRTDLADTEGRAITSVQIQPDNYAGEAPWYVLLPTAEGGEARHGSATVRVRREPRTGGDA